MLNCSKMNQPDGPKTVSTYKVCKFGSMEACSTKYTATQGKQISPTDSENCSTILDKLQEDRLLKVKHIRSFRSSGGATVSQTPELASFEDNEKEESDASLSALVGDEIP